MFNSISGLLSGKTTDSVYVENSGIEWEIFVSALALDAFGPVGREVKVYTWLYHREDQMRLFGFPNQAERSLFLDLTKVEGVGPRQALKIMSGLNASSLEKALEEGDLDTLQKAPGVGKKTAQKMILALKGKLTNLNETSSKGLLLVSSEYEDIVRALTDMGFERKSVIAQVEKIAEEMKTAGSDPLKNEEELFRRSIVALS
ncbi:Holliday junction branch migration protein RuvA [Treponema sp. OMZ 799]|uniref:Holliday junction branch migration protein RuvA n=1 Tax=Treponema sp. OMZ 799 TaxID=2563668 RepID=UPI0020A2FF6D|nr:Holliday junction branch migration protein RuvA [Treponema sp. OMZ 799]UTC78214.1 Holliday junction branch migration protein RuvA [Treponema sp. OMZ 799]